MKLLNKINLLSQPTIYIKKSLFISILALIMSSNCNSQETLKIADFLTLNNTNWIGQLTYKDYQSGKQTSIDATLQIAIEDDKIIFNIQYTYEPNKNHVSSVKLKKNGTYFGNEKILTHTFNNGVRTFVTTYKGRDNNRRATLFITRQWTEKTYKVTKEVQYHGTNDRFVRNTYEYQKQKI